jgi:hypothetical protein
MSGLLIQAFKGLGMLQVSGTVLGRDRDERISTCMKCQKALGNKAILHFMRYLPDVYNLVSRLLSVRGLIDSTDSHVIELETEWNGCRSCGQQDAFLHSLEAQGCILDTEQVF